MALLPDIPTVAEFVPGYEATDWLGVAAPRNTSPEIIDKLNRQINAGLADPILKGHPCLRCGDSGSFGVVREACCARRHRAARRRERQNVERNFESQDGSRPPASDSSGRCWSGVGDAVTATVGFRRVLCVICISGLW
jgi:Tripartite tricarboxylate transporter family receptor